MSNRRLLEVRTVEVKGDYVTVSYAKNTCSKSIAWTHLEHNYPPEVLTRKQLKLSSKMYNPWRKSHDAHHWNWYAKVSLPKPLQPHVCIPIGPYEMVKTTKEGALHHVVAPGFEYDFRYHPNGLMSMEAVEVINLEGVKKLELRSEDG